MTVKPIHRQTYIPSYEITPYNSTLEKVTMLGMLLGAGLLFASMFTSIHWLIGTAVLVISHFVYTYVEEAREGSTLIDAAKEGHRDQVISQLFWGANPNVTRHDINPISAAALFGHVEILSDLLNAGGNPNITDTYDRTPLSEAVVGAHNDCVALLLSRGADRTIATKNLKDAGTPLACAKRQQKFCKDNPFVAAMSEVLDTPCPKKDRVAAIDRIVELLEKHNT